MSGLIHTKVLIIGSGPAGWTAAIYAARANLKPILITGASPGGQLMITTDVENYPGFPSAVQGPWLMEQFEQQAEHAGTQIIRDHVKQVSVHGRIFTCITESEVKYSCESLIIATGAQAKWLGIPSEQKYQGHGVSGCATCDGFFFKGKDIAVVGGGNTAVEEALYLTRFANSVTLIHRRDKLRAEKVAQDRLFGNEKIKVIWNHVVEEVLGEDEPLHVTGVRIKDIISGATRVLPVEGLFIAIGHTPNTALFKDLIDLDSENYIITAPNSTKTNIPGVFAAGDVQDKIYRQAVTAAGTGCMAALEAERYLGELEQH
jgi:thioredoxin reductase (NADPH)